MLSKWSLIIVSYLAKKRLLSAGVERTEVRPEMNPWKLDCGRSFCPPQPSGKLPLVPLIWKQLGVAETSTYVMCLEDRRAQGLGLKNQRHRAQRKLPRKSLYLVGLVYKWWVVVDKIYGYDNTFIVFWELGDSWLIGTVKSLPVTYTSAFRRCLTKFSSILGDRTQITWCAIFFKYKKSTCDNT